MDAGRMTKARGLKKADREADFLFTDEIEPSENTFWTETAEFCQSQLDVGCSALDVQGAIAARLPMR